MNLENDNTEFKEEVPESELHSKLGVDDHIYISKRRGIYGGPLLMFFALFLAFAALFATFYGLVSLNKDLRDRHIGVVIDEYHLKVIHTNDLYGGNIKSFSKYGSSDKYFSYKFSVVNENSVDLDYTMSLEAKNKSSNLNLKSVNYPLLKNGDSIKSGKFSNFGVYSVTCLKNSTDKYEIRLWSDGSIENSNLTFKVKVVGKEAL